MSEYAIRNFRWDDLDAIAEVWNAAAQAVDSDLRYTRSQLRMFLEMPDAHPETDCWIVEDGDRVIGYAADEFDADSGQGWGECAVHPDYQNRGVGTRLLHLTDARIAQRIQAEAKPEMPLFIMRVAVPEDTFAIQLFCGEGYREVRAFYTMELALQQPIEVPKLPDGIVLRPFDAEYEARKVYEAHQEAFRDHWNHSTDMPYDEWERLMINHPDNDLSLWLIAWEGDEVAGVALSRRRDEERTDEAWLSVLGVRRSWRKRGLGLALLKHSFALFQQRGFKSAALGVDGSSLTNAVALYERAGMSIQQERRVFRKMVRGSEDDLHE